MYFSLYTEETGCELIMTPCETNTLVTEFFTLLNRFYYDIIYLMIIVSLHFFIYRTIGYNFYWCS